MRRKPYTQIGIRRVPCKRCGRPSRFQWSVCATNNEQFAVCERCDILLNEIVLLFFKIHNSAVLLRKYARKVYLQIKVKP